jgi:hypothetical protein
LTYDELADICETVAPDVAKILRGERPRNKNGRPKKETVSRDTVLPPTGASRHRTVPAARLQQEHPDYYQGFLDGKYRSIRNAAEACGLVKPGHDPLARMKAYWRKAPSLSLSGFSFALSQPIMADMALPPNDHDRQVAELHLLAMRARELTADSLRLRRELYEALFDAHETPLVTRQLLRVDVLKQRRESDGGI